MRMIYVLGLLTALGLLSGCWTTIMVDGQKVHDGSWENAQTELRRRAAFEMPCDGSKIKMTLLETNANNIPPLPWGVGATGCGQRLVYKIVLGSGWVLNSRTRVE
jgi:hypothetical protein